MKLVMHIGVLLLLTCVGVIPSGAAKKLSVEDEKRVETLYLTGKKQLDAAEFDQAIASFRAALELNDDHAPAYVGLGHAFLAQGDLDEAEKAFKTALRKEKKYAPAFNGLGLVYSQKKNELRRAIRYFRDANRADKTYSEAQYNLAQTLERYGSSETLKEYENVLKIDAQHPQAHYRIGLIYERDRDYEKAVQAFRNQLAANEKHAGARLHLGIGLKVLGQTEEAVSVLARAASDSSAFQRRAVLELAQVFQKRREFDKAAQLFEAYIGKLSDTERAIYRDLSYVARGANLERFQAAKTLEEKERLFRDYWQSLDPAPVTEANERLLEHYRRVAFAREYFGEYRTPWDDRGEAYIRYGDPDHISRSGGGLNIERHPLVVAVKERLIARAGNAAVALMQERADAVASAMTQSGGASGGEDRATRQRDLDVNILGWPVYPVPVDSHWEYWIYVGVGGGIELTFVQTNYPGPYEYAEAPLGVGDNARIWQDMNPEFVIQRVSARRPSTYRADFATGPLDFHFYTAAFRGEADKTALEIYYGIPTAELSFVDGDDGQQVAILDRGVAVYDGLGNVVHRHRSEMVLGASGEVNRAAGSLVPEVDRVALPPGSYRVSVQVLDRASGKSQVYNQNRFVPAFPADDKLKISDVELAARIDTEDQSRFQKGDLSVVPMASLAYLPAQPVFIYFELYNLKRDEFGQTKYRVSYEVRSTAQKNVGARILGGVGKLLGQRSEAGVIAIEYEQVGTEPQEQGYLELDLSSTEPGEQMLQIRVIDDNSGQSTGVSTKFTIR